MSRVRTNIEIEETYVQTIMERYHLRTETEAVDLALRALAGQPMTSEEVTAGADDPASAGTRPLNRAERRAQAHGKKASGGANPAIPHNQNMRGPGGRGPGGGASQVRLPSRSGSK